SDRAAPRHRDTRRRPRSHPIRRCPTSLGSDMTSAPEPKGRHLALVGTTASGKSAVAFEIARSRPDIELVSVDSMCVYRGMDVGTAKPTPAQRAEVPHHLL